MHSINTNEIFVLIYNLKIARSKPKSVDEAQIVALECDQIKYKVKSQASIQQSEYYNIVDVI